MGKIAYSVGGASAILGLVLIAYGSSINDGGLSTPLFWAFGTVVLIMVTPGIFIGSYFSKKKNS